jgi:hypothetical protein
LVKPRISKLLGDVVSSVKRLLTTYSCASGGERPGDLGLLALRGHHQQQQVAVVGVGPTALDERQTVITGMFQSTRATAGRAPSLEHCSASASVARLHDGEFHGDQEDGSGSCA